MDFFKTGEKYSFSFDTVEGERQIRIGSWARKITFERDIH